MILTGPQNFERFVIRRVSNRLGFGIQQKGHRTYIMHGGDNKGFHSFSAATSNGHFGYVIMTNGDNGSAALKKLMIDHLNPFLAVA